MRPRPALALLMALALAIVLLGGCGSQPEPPTTQPPATTAPPTTITPPPEAPEPLPRQGPLGVVDTGFLTRGGLSLQRIFVCDADTTLFFVSPLNGDGTISESMLVYSYSAQLGGLRPASYVAGVINLYPSAVLDDGRVTLVTLNSESYAFDSLIFLDPVTLEATQAPLPPDDFYDLHISPDGRYAAITTYDYLRVTSLDYKTEYLRIDRVGPAQWPEELLDPAEADEPVDAEILPPQAEALAPRPLTASVETLEDGQADEESPPEAEPPIDDAESPSDEEPPSDEELPPIDEDIPFVDEMIPSATGWSLDSRYLCYQVLGWESAYGPGIICTDDWTVTAPEGLEGCALYPVGEELFLFQGCFGDLPAGYYSAAQGRHATLPGSLIAQDEDVIALVGHASTYTCVLTVGRETQAGAVYVVDQTGALAGYFAAGDPGQSLLQTRYAASALAVEAGDVGGAGLASGAGSAWSFEQAFFTPEGDRLVLLARQSPDAPRTVITYDFLG